MLVYQRVNLSETWISRVSAFSVAPEARSTFLARPHPTTCTPGRAGAAPKRSRIITKIPRCCCTRRAIASQCCSLMRRRSMRYCAKRSSVMAWRNLEILVTSLVDGPDGKLLEIMDQLEVPSPIKNPAIFCDFGDPMVLSALISGWKRRPEIADPSWKIAPDVKTVAEPTPVPWIWKIHNGSWSCWSCWCLISPQPAVAETKGIQNLGKLTGFPVAAGRLEV